MDMINEQLQKKIDRAIRLLQGVQNGYDGEIYTFVMGEDEACEEFVKWNGKK